VKAALRKSSNWKTPGADGIPNFWLKHLEEVHDDMARNFSTILHNPDQCPHWLTRGITYLLPKTDQTTNPKNYRPITCLPTTYKTLTSIIVERIYTFLETQKLLPPEQKGCRRHSYGCKDQLLINRMIMEDNKKRKTNLSTSWIDYRKAFDSVPHSWITKTMEIYKLSPTMIKFMRHSMNMWKTTMVLNHSNGTIKTGEINIRSGIFQGDSLSPLLFCLSLAPLSTMLNIEGCGYKIRGHKINHLFYMDDLKLYGKDDRDLEKLLVTVKTFTDDIKMEFGLDKCAKATFLRGKLTKTSDIVLDDENIIQEIDQEETYKYLGVHEGEGIQHAKMKEKIRKEYYRRIRLVIKSELNSANKMKAINSLATPVVTYSYNIINWNMSEIKRLDSKTRKLLTMERMHHPKADVDRIYLPRSEGGRGLIQLEKAYKTTVIGLHAYLEHTEDTLMKLVNAHEKQKKSHSVFKEAKKYSRELQMETLPSKEDRNITEYAKKIKKIAKEHATTQQKEVWRSKPLHGQYPNRVQKPDVEQSQTHRWLRSAGLKAETEGLIIAAQDQSLATRAHQHYIFKNVSIDPTCRMCHEHDETVDHLVSGCPVLARNEFIHRHDRAATYIHWKILHHYNLPTASKWYEHRPSTVSEGNGVTILWDMKIFTDRLISANRPDIIIKDIQNKTCYMIDMAVPSERNVSTKEVEKLSKYKDLEIEINRMWGMRTVVIPVVIGALGLVKKDQDRYISMIPGKVDISELQKIVLLGTAHILRKTLSIK